MTTKRIRQPWPGRPCAAWLAAACLAVWVGPAWSAPFAGLVFEDAPSLTPDALLPAYSGEIGKPMDEALSRRVCRALIELYERHGYLPPAPRPTRAHEPAGVLVMEMREAHVAHLRLDEHAGVTSPELHALLTELRQARPLSRSGFHRWLRRANDLGYAAAGSLHRMEPDSPEYLARVRVAQRRFDGMAHVDNRGPAQLGREIARASLTYRWPSEMLGHLRADTAVAADTERLRYLGLSGAHRVRQRGDKLAWSYAASESTLPIAGTERTVDYERERAELRWTRPLVRHVRQRADLSVALRSYDLDQFLDDGRRLRRDRIRTAEVVYRLSTAGEGGRRHFLEVSVNQGLEGLGASASPPGVDIGFFSLGGRYVYRRNLAAWQAWGEVHLQASEDTLPSSERFFIGGRSLGGAFDPATLSGDQGLGLRAGLDRPFTAFGRPLTGFAYYDHGYVWSHDEARPADDAGSAGLGLRGALGKLSWSVEAAVPVRKPETPTLLEDDVRAFFSLTQRF